MKMDFVLWMLGDLLTDWMFIVTMLLVSLCIAVYVKGGESE